MKKILFIFLLLQVVVAQDEAFDFSQREDYYSEFCNDISVSKNNNEQQRCTEFYDYMSAKTESMEQWVERTNQKATDVALEIEQITPKIEQLHQQIDENQGYLDTLELTINGADNEIAMITRKIVVAQTKKAEMDLKLKQSQPFNTKYYQPYTQALRDIDKYQQRLEQFVKERDEVSAGMGDILDLIKEAEALKAELKALKKELDLVLMSYKQKEALILDTINTKVDNMAEIRSLLSNIGDSLIYIEPSKNMVSPINRGLYSQSAGTWFYPASFGGGLHLGVDLAAELGTQVVAPFSGVIIYTASSCADNGYLGNTCGLPGNAFGGNQVYLVGEVNGDFYATSLVHLQANSIIVKPGDLVSQGQHIANVGNSGNSTGAHLHMNLFKIKTNSLAEFTEQWDGDLTFGAGNGQRSYDNRCMKPNDTNCRIQPEGYIRF